MADELEALPCKVQDVDYVPGKAGVFFRCGLALAPPVLRTARI